ncbi:hypothetical protein AMS68_001189 [Peltaster fructicola]|uniref:Uncharacterized protein n=1 Tax=Peltaster fructicola TaxID=286661 RepID=A0A6H0XLP6_9PEZI|nr:hypothetical protein AMS68_001189 [Peltaster fructicola]
MSLMRSLTTRRKPEVADTPIMIRRAATQRGGRPVPRAQISPPIALVSTTNMLSFNAPNIAGTKPIEYNSSSSSEESDENVSVHSQDTDPTDLSSAEASPTSASHLNQFFQKEELNSSADTSPILPSRAPSHSKLAHETLSRQRSINRARSPSAQGRMPKSPSMRPPRSPSAQGRGVSRTRLRTSGSALLTPTPHFIDSSPESPFSKEMAQLDAVTEEFGSSQSEEEADALWMKSRDLACFVANDYLNEIDGLVNDFLIDSPPEATDYTWF